MEKNSQKNTIIFDKRPKTPLGLGYMKKKYSTPKLKVQRVSAALAEIEM